jgi:hypothetical protein
LIGKLDKGQTDKTRKPIISPPKKKGRRPKPTPNYADRSLRA